MLQYTQTPEADVAAVVDVTEWWTIPLNNDQFTAYIRSLVVPGLGGGAGVPGDSTQPPDAGFLQGGLANNADASLDVEWIPDGDQVTARVDAQVIWLAPRTPLETLVKPAATAVLRYSYTEPVPPPFGGGDTSPRPAHVRRTVSGAALRQVIALVNAATPQGPWVRAGCPPGPEELATFTLSEAGHRVVIETGVDTCWDIRVIVDKKLQQPSLTGGWLLLRQVYAILGIESTPVPRVPPQGPPVTTPAPAITVLEHTKVQAQRVGDRALSGYGVYLPEDARPLYDAADVPRPPYVGPGHLVDRTDFYTVKGTPVQLVAWLRAYAPKGYVVAQPPSSPKSVRVVLEPKGAHRAVAAVVWITLAQRGDNVIWRVDAYTCWKAKSG